MFIYNNNNNAAFTSTQTRKHKYTLNAVLIKHQSLKLKKTPIHMYLTHIHPTTEFAPMLISLEKQSEKSTVKFKTDC